MATLQEVLEIIAWRSKNLIDYAYVARNLLIILGITIFGTSLAAIIDCKYGFFADMKNGFKNRY